MDRDTIIRLAREAGWSGIYTQWREPDGGPDWTPVKESLTVPVTMEQIERFAALVAGQEREECARICDATRDDEWTPGTNVECAAAIRSRT